MSISSEDSSYREFLQLFMGRQSKANNTPTVTGTIDASSTISSNGLEELPQEINGGVSYTSSTDDNSWDKSSLFASEKEDHNMKDYENYGEEDLESGLKQLRQSEDKNIDEFLRIAFHQADVDSNGKISFDELKLLMRQLGLKISDDDLDAWVTEIDLDCDGEISFFEFMMIFQKEKENDRLIRILRDTFESYDADGSGCIDSMELRMLMAQLGHDITEDMAKEMISHVDQDGNGEIDFEEFVAMFKGAGVHRYGGVVRDRSTTPPKLVNFGRKSSMNSILEESVSIFDDAKALVPIDPFFQFVMWLYSNRVLVLLAVTHFVATVLIWVNFGLVKWYKNDVPVTASWYWIKTVVPPILYGSKFAVAFQMALLPLTMSRYSIASLSGSKLNQYIPLNKALRMHIHLGYITVSIVFLACTLFCTCYGTLCMKGEESYCDMFTSEIMVTGYCIVGVCLLMACTAFYRHTIPYELFYAVHFLFLVFYILTIVHTLDVAQRSGARDRSQTFKWFSLPLLFYFCDYAMMYTNKRFEPTVTEFTAIEDHEGSKMIILKMNRPTLFIFKPGQYAFLRVRGIDRSWHPFTIASAPRSSMVEFYIEVFAGGWTEKLWSTLKNDAKPGFKIELMGPYGTGLIKEPKYTNIIAIGSGTGIVPCISLLKQHVKSMLMMDPDAFLISLKEEEAEHLRIRCAEEVNNESLFKHFLRPVVRKRNKEHDKSSLRSARRQESVQNMMARSAASRRSKTQAALLKFEVLKATRMMYTKLITMACTFYAITVFGVVLILSTTPVPLSRQTIYGVEISIVVLHSIFLASVFVLWNGVSLQSYFDAVVCIICPFVDWYFHTYLIQAGGFGGQVIFLVLLNGYIAIRLYQTTLAAVDLHSSSNETVGHVEFIWSVRTAKVARQILPEIEETYQALVKEWGAEKAHDVLSIRIHITEKNQDEAAAYRAEIRNSLLFKNKAVVFIRPKLDEILEDHQTTLVDELAYSSTLIAFCGGPMLSSVLSEKKRKLELFSAALGYNNHTLDFVSESYGGPKRQASGGKRDKAAKVDEKEITSLWDLVKKETTNSVNSRRIKHAFQDSGKITDAVREFATRKEMLEVYRRSGNELHYMRNRASAIQCRPRHEISQRRMAQSLPATEGY